MMDYADNAGGGLQGVAVTSMTDPAPHLGRPGRGDGAPPDRTLPSSALLQGARCVQIVHNGTVYRLHATRLGKLILTK